jgi:peptide-methionine (S)-S-oxide reductase
MRIFLLTLLAAFALYPIIGKTAETATKTALFAGGCFWCMESLFSPVPGVTDVQSGFAGGHIVNPTYEQVSRGDTGHREVVQVTYDPAVVSYERLLEIFWPNSDPFDLLGQFCDKGEQYTTAIFVNDETERAAAEASKAEMEKRFGKPVVTKILPSAPFYPADEHHQDFYKKNALRYNMYRKGCGRDERLKEVWGNEAEPPKH